MVKFSTVQLGNISTPSSSLFNRGLGNQTPSFTPKYEREGVDHQSSKWLDSDEEASLVHLMVTEVRKGNKKKTFNKRAWETIEQGFYEKTGKNNILPQLKNKYNTLKSCYNDFNKLLKEPGFSWNPAMGHAIASNADWEACLKTNKRAKVFRRKGCPLYNELGIIYGDPIAGCENVTPSIQCSLDSEVKCGTEDESTKSSQSNPAKDSVDREEEPYATTLHTGHFRQQSLTPLVDHQMNKSGTDATETTAIVSCQQDQIPHPYATSKIDVSGPKTPNSSNDELKLFSTDFSITACVKCLESIHGIDSMTYVKAVKMFKDVDWREMFMAMSAERRMDWLASLE